MNKFNTLYNMFMEDRRETYKYWFTTIKNKVTTVFDKISKVVVELEDSDSARASQLAKKYMELKDEEQKAVKGLEKLKPQLLELGEEYFDMEDKLLTRVIKTVSYTIQISALERAKLISKTDYEAVMADLIKMVPELSEKIEELKIKYTDVSIKEPAKPRVIVDTDKPKVKSKLTNESILTTIKTWFENFNLWLKSYDKKLDSIKQKFNLKD